MVKKILALCDSEEDYVCHMADYLEKKDMLPFAVHVFTERVQLEKFDKRDKIALLLMAENIYEESVKEWFCGQLLILNESGNIIGEGIENINKYQSSENIFRRVMSCYTEAGGEVSQRITMGNQMKIIGNYTPVGRCLQTTFSLSMGQLLAKKHKTLYLNFESYSGFEVLFGRKYITDIGDVLYYFNSEKEKLAYKLEGITESLHGLDYIPPVSCGWELRTVGGGQWLELFQEIERVSDYEYLILDLSEQVDGLLDILQNCYRVFTIIQEDSAAKAKLQQYEERLHTAGYEEITLKTRKWKPPIFQKLPPVWEQLTGGELAVCVKKIIEEDVYG